MMKSFSKILFLVVFCAFLQPAFVHASPLNLELVDDHIDITVGFSGSKLSVFGTKDASQHVAIIVEGPPKNATIRKKSQVLGAWMNTSSKEFKETPGYYDYALSIEPSEITSYSFLLSHDVSPQALQVLRLEPSEKGKSADDERVVKRVQVERDKHTLFKDAFIRNMEALHLYKGLPQKVDVLSPEFFRADFMLPANVPTGIYNIRAIVFNKSGVVEQRQTVLKVAQVGKNAVVYSFAVEYSFAYGLMCVILALLAGWGINVLRRNN